MVNGRGRGMCAVVVRPSVEDGRAVREPWMIVMVLFDGNVVRRLSLR